MAAAGTRAALASWSKGSTNGAADGDEVARLVFAEQPGIEGIVDRHRRVDAGADVAGHGHLGQRHQQAAVGEVVAGGEPAAADQLADEIAVAALGREVDGRRRAVLAAVDLAQIDRAGRDGPWSRR